MICSLNSLKNSLQKETLITVLGSSEPELQLFLDRWGIGLQKVWAKLGPWGSFIIKTPSQQIALGPAFAQQLEVEI
jgi:hypothetical protein